jgi:hypothetical protein
MKNNVICTLIWVVDRETGNYPLGDRNETIIAATIRLQAVRESTPELLQIQIHER